MDTEQLEATDLEGGGARGEDLSAGGLLEGTRVEVEHGGAALVGVGEREDQGDRGTGKPPVGRKRNYAPRRDNKDLSGTDPRKRLACEMLSEAFKVVMRNEDRLRANPHVPSSTRGKWRADQDDAIRFLSTETFWHLLADRTPELCLKRAKEIVRTGR